MEMHALGLQYVISWSYWLPPAAVLAETYAPKLARMIAEETKKHGAQEIVLGLPRNMDGSEGFRAQKCRAFALQLEEACGIPVRALG